VQESDRFVAHGYRVVFDRELLQVREGVVRMGELVAVAIDGAVGALAHHDTRAAAAIVANDRVINAAQTDLTELVITTIATQAPVAGDLRFVLSLSHITYELERIGDHAAGVAKQVPRIGAASNSGGASLDRMGELASSILKASCAPSSTSTWRPRGGGRRGRRDRPALPRLLRAIARTHARRAGLGRGGRSPAVRRQGPGADRRPG